MVNKSIPDLQIIIFEGVKLLQGQNMQIQHAFPEQNPQTVPPTPLNDPTATIQHRRSIQKLQ